MKNQILIFGILVTVILVIGISWYLYSNQPRQRTGGGTCQDLCGDGICQEVVCEAIGCPCAETSMSCPQDCDLE